jgi:hypothetical protein
VEGLRFSSQLLRDTPQPSEFVAAERLSTISLIYMAGGSDLCQLQWFFIFFRDVDFC